MVDRELVEERVRKERLESCSVVIADETAPLPRIASVEQHFGRAAGLP